MGLLCALAICLSFLEGLIPQMVPVAGIKLGLSNIVVMYALFQQGPRPALLLATLKALFAALVRGLVGGLLALCGGVLSVLVMLLVLYITKQASYTTVSICGAVMHNVGQLAGAALLLQVELWLYLPVLVGSGIVMGSITAVLLRVVLPMIPDRWRSAGEDI